MDLKTTSCRWPFGDPRLPGFGFCGAAAAPGSRYCAEHKAIAFVAER
jgi:GcrA cell cycle regulator